MSQSVGSRGDDTRLRGLAAWRTVLGYASDPVACFERMAAERGPVVRVARSRLGWRGEALLLVGPEHNREVLLASGRLRPTGIWPVRAPAGSAQANLRANYLVMHGEEHAAFASATAPLLERGAVRGHHEAVRRIAAEEVGRWQPGTEADVYALARDLAQHYAFALIFGEGEAARRQEFGSMLAAYHQANWSWAARLLRLDWPGTPYRRVLRLADRLQDFMIRWDTACPHARGTNGADASNVRVALACMQGVAPERNAAHLAGFGLAAYETTAATLAWALVLLATHADAQAALLKELEGAGPLDSMTPEALAALPVLDGVIRETLRLVAPVPFLGFRTMREGEFGGEALPEGATVFISPHLTHRMPAVGVAPRLFGPARWRGARPGPWDYLPFAGGPRRCPGALFAENNLRVALATIVPRLKLSLAGAPVDRAYAAITFPKHGVRMRIERQDGRALPSRPVGNFFDMVDVA